MVAARRGGFYREGMRDPLAQPAPLIRRVYAYVAYRVGDGPDAEDITSETFERALRYRESFDARRGEPAAWLIGIARRCIADRALMPDRVAVAAPDAVDDGHEDEALRSIELQRALAQLNERDREILALRYGADMTVRDIAAAMELRTNTVEVALHRALSRLRGELDDGVTVVSRRGGAARPAGDATAL
jgi:RNA polymerase sigma-70 factor (ECF subfamily)